MLRLTALAAFGLLPSIVYAQSRDTSVVSRDNHNGICSIPVYKDPAAATIFSFLLPGSGQIYGGRALKGGTILALSLASAAVVVGNAATISESAKKSSNYAVGAGGVLWLYGLLTAGEDTRERNRKVRSYVATGSYGPQPCPRWP